MRRTRAMTSARRYPGTATIGYSDNRYREARHACMPACWRAQHRIQVRCVHGNFTTDRATRASAAVRATACTMSVLRVSVATLELVLVLRFWYFALRCVRVFLGIVRVGASR